MKSGLHLRKYGKCALDRWSEWNLGHFLDTKNMKFTSEVNTPEDKYRVGASARPKWEATFKVTESLKNEKITYLIEERGTNRATLTCILEPIDEGTKLTYGGSYEMPWGIFGKFIEKLVKGIGERQLEKSLEKLKSIAEK